MPLPYLSKLMLYVCVKYRGTGTRNMCVHNESYIHAHQAWGEKKQSGRGPSYIAQEKPRRAVICPLIVIYCDSRGTRADGWTFACEIGNGIRAWISSRTAGRTSGTRAENGACLTQLYTLNGGQGSAVSPCWHVDTYHLYLIMSAEDRPREQASERAACGKKKREAPPHSSRPPCHSPFCTSLAAKNAANWTCQSRWNIDRGPVLVPVVESEIPTG